MTDKEFRRLSRAELIEIIYELQKNEEQLQTELEQARQQLADRELKISQAGSIAQAVVGLNDIFAVAQKTADDYLEQIRRRTVDIEAQAQQLHQRSQELAQRELALDAQWAAVKQAAEKGGGT